MIIASTFKFHPGAKSAAAEKFLSGEAQMPDGVKLIGRWHFTDMSGGIAVVETNDPKLAYTGAAVWADLVDIEHHVALTDDEVSPLIAAHFGS